MKAAFVEPMLLERCSTLPESYAWLVEPKLDGFRGIGSVAEAVTRRTV